MDIKDYGLDRVIICPPVAGVCPVCAVNHAPTMPHNRDSLYYQMRFQQKHGRFPTWADAMAHCDEHIRAVWVGLLAEHGVKVDGLADIQTRPEGTEDGS